MQGGSVSLSADGNTAILGGVGDNQGTGAAWVLTRSGGVWTQQGGKLVGTGASPGAGQGASVALSADGNTAVVGASADNEGMGAAWIFTRSGGVWTQQGDKLVGTGATAYADQGGAVALSADGNTVIVGGDGDNGRMGAVWVFTRSDGVWTQQGSKLVGTGSGPGALQGSAIALSADGNTAIVGGPVDNENFGAAWVFTRSGGAWTQQGRKLVGTGANFFALQGASVALSADGDTALVGGPVDDGMGAVWVFTRSAGVWSQQGSKLVGTGAIGDAGQGTSVALSADGNTAIVGGPWDGNTSIGIGDGDNDTTDIGAAWVFTRSGGVWTQRGSKLVGSGAAGYAQQGRSVALSADGNTAMVGGWYDNGNIGAAWVYAASAPSPTLARPATLARSLILARSLALARSPTPSQCLWAGRAFSQGAIFCMGPSTAVRCDKTQWTTSTYAPCNTAPPIDAK